MSSSEKIPIRNGKVMDGTGNPAIETDVLTSGDHIEKIGQIKEGFSADFIGIDLENPNLKFSKDIYSAITMRAEPSDIEFQMYKGRLVKWKDQK